MTINNPHPWESYEVIADCGDNRQIQYNPSESVNAHWRVQERNVYVYFDSEYSACEYAVSHGWYNKSLKKE